LSDGPYTDFNTGWFKSVGNVLVDAMMFKHKVTYQVLLLIQPHQHRL
jgi:hypothetical protein